MIVRSVQLRPGQPDGATMAPCRSNLAQTFREGLPHLVDLPCGS
jgi:hypothetical protein